MFVLKHRETDEVIGMATEYPEAEEIYLESPHCRIEEPFKGKDCEYAFNVTNGVESLWYHFSCNSVGEAWIKMTNEDYEGIPHLVSVRIKYP